MKSMALINIPVSNHQVGFWTAFRKLFQVQEAVRDTAIPLNFAHSDQEEFVFFNHEYEMEDYIRSFRE
ncbi:MAG: hypothetical protein IT573_00190 [Deltaproteobacteria bacterium]|nr:hypothetical protein [Deltaproteobacteria bacterium]